MLSTILKEYRYGLYSVGAFSAVINVLMLTPSLYMLQVYDRVLSSGNQMTLLMLTLLVTGLYLFSGVMEWARSLTVIRMGTRLDLSLNQRVFDAAFEHNLKYGDERAGLALNDLTTLRQFATGNALFALFDAPWFLLFLGVVFLLHPWLGWLALGGSALLIALAWLNQRYTEHPLAESGKMSRLATHQASMHLRNTDAIEAMGMLGNIRRHWLKHHYAFLYQQGIASERTAVSATGAKTARLILQSLILGMGALLAVRGEITAGMMIAGSILIGRVLSPIDQLIAVSKQWNSAHQAWQRLQDLFQHHGVRPSVMTLPAPVGNIRVEGLLYRPDPESTPLLYDIDFTLPAGETLGILGASGTGKSTLARLLAGALEPTMGSVRLDNADLYQMNREATGTYIGYLPQDIQLFSGTVAQNICRFGEPDPQGVVAAARMAGVHELILSLPQGYNTLLGELGRGLSGGQKQRVALARALYGTPRLIILDEPDASLDAEGDRALQTVLGELKAQRCTLILITHRSGLMKLTDSVLLLKPGQMPYFGSSENLLKKQQTRHPSPDSREQAP